ncbi:MAG TPA: hypothetical protein VF532_20390 [Candidatus Angelobacter sp.]
MNNSTSALPTLTQPRFDPGCERRLAGSVVARTALTHGERNEMYELLEMYFAGTCRARFEADLAEKESVILLRDAESGRIQGFSTSMRISACIDGQEVVAFFSGDTIVAREFWGESLLSRLWSQTAFAEADRIVAAHPAARVYWFLICSGYRTWRFLPVFFREFYPHPERPTPPHEQRILDTLGAQKFGDQYMSGSGVVRFDSATPLRQGVAEVTDRHLRDPHIAFFSRMNPGHATGDELACLTEISRANLTRAGVRMVTSPVKQS